jgi:hypothetical protein
MTPAQLQGSGDEQLLQAVTLLTQSQGYVIGK